jgi:hypothetical protein
MNPYHRVLGRPSDATSHQILDVDTLFDQELAQQRNVHNISSSSNSIPTHINSLPGPSPVQQQQQQHMSVSHMIARNSDQRYQPYYNHRMYPPRPQPLNLNDGRPPQSISNTYVPTTPPSPKEKEKNTRFIENISQRSSFSSKINGSHLRYIMSFKGKIFSLIKKFIYYYNNN